MNGFDYKDIGMQVEIVHILAIADEVVSKAGRGAGVKF
jgi:hypothetical protein